MDARREYGGAVSAVPDVLLRPEDVRPRFIAGRDGKFLRIATFDAAPGTPPRGVCVLLHGQTEFVEKYVEVIGELRQRGFQVATLDWRGQGGSARALANPLKAHIGDFSQYDSDLRVFLEKVVHNLSDRPPVALAHSMGGHILLRVMHQAPNAFRAAVLSAPMLRALTRGYPARLARAYCFMQNLLGRQGDWVLGMKERDPLKMSFHDQLVTSDRARWERTQAILRQYPSLRLAGPSWGWLEAAYHSMQTVMSPGYADSITTPTLIVGAGRDRIVDVAAGREFAARLPRGQYEEIPDAEHEILMENDSVRMRFWRMFDAFVARYA